MTAKAQSRMVGIMAMPQTAPAASAPPSGSRGGGPPKLGLVISNPAGRLSNMDATIMTHPKRRTRRATSQPAMIMAIGAIKPRKKSAMPSPLMSPRHHSSCLRDHDPGRTIEWRNGQGGVQAGNGLGGHFAAHAISQGFKIFRGDWVRWR
ncbi:hypothetical protein [Caulobacter sp. DWP3-1-3b2]|uniref:hypothetical protein n=1 Tax=Caulobacter sp. DWP3-1-3b2 TaxID=2804643 RepID=UPI003CF6DAD5